MRSRSRVLVEGGKARQRAVVVVQVAGLLRIFSGVGALHVLSVFKRRGRLHGMLLGVAIRGGGCALLLGGDRVLHPLVKMLDHGTRLQEPLVLLGELLVHGGEVEFSLAVGHVLQIHIVARGHVVGTVKDLILLQVHLESCLVREVNQVLLEFNEVLRRGDRVLHALQGLGDRALDGEQLALAQTRLPIRRVGHLGVVKMEVLVDASLAEGHLVHHTEGVDDGVVLVAEEDA